MFFKDKLFIPSPNGLMPINYLVYPSQFTIIPASLVLKKQINPSDFKDKIVLVGATSSLIHDEYLTPLGVHPGVTIIGNCIVMMLSKRFIQQPSIAANILIILSSGLFIILINHRLRS